MIKIAVRAMAATGVLAVLTGLMFPLAITGVAQLVLRDKANGSLVWREGAVVGSTLVGQAWEGPEWFYGRPSATATPYDGAASAGSNRGPGSRALSDSILERVGAIESLEGEYRPGIESAQIPVDLLTASGSGLDPHISPEAALFQVPRIAKVRELDAAVVNRLVKKSTFGQGFRIIGQPRVNVLQLNLALEDLTSD